MRYIDYAVIGNQFTDQCPAKNIIHLSAKICTSLQRFSCRRLLFGVAIYYTTKSLHACERQLIGLSSHSLRSGLSRPRSVIKNERK